MTAKKQPAQNTTAKAKATTTTTQPAKQASTQPAKQPARPKREVADVDTRLALRDRLRATQEATGLSRRQLATLVFGDEAHAEYRIWRFQDDQRNGYAADVAPITRTLDAIDAGEIELPEKPQRGPRTTGPTKNDLAQMVEAVKNLADATFQRQKATAGEKKLAQHVLETLGEK